MSTSAEKDYQLLTKLVKTLVDIEDRKIALINEPIFEENDEEEAAAFFAINEEKDLVITGMRCWLRDHKHLLS